MALLFSYGTLQLEETQVSLFGRPVRGTPDELIGFERTRVPITNSEALASSGETHHENVVHNGQPGSRVIGTLLEVTDDDLAAADAYERAAEYERALETLASGAEAWVYRHSSASKPPADGGR
jgi:hypothetical protein